ncbi:hypothetical protein PV350_33845 [Streptomyces sp. PA03-6a]|nr:hypothetical protein [Streptomyces sp. PA03-6a]
MFRTYGPRPDWTSADFDSYEALALAGIRNPAARVSRARARRRPHRRAIRAALTRLRTTRHALALRHRSA